MRLPFAALAAAAAVSALVVGPTALARAHPAGGGGASTANIQGNDQQSWINDPHMRQFYDLSVTSLKRPPSADEVSSYEQKAYAIFRDFASSRGMSPDAMQDHLKLIPRQVAQIAKDDPKVLDSYSAFVDAVFGPQ